MWIDRELTDEEIDQLFDWFAKQIPVLVQRQYPRWVHAITLGFILIGLVSALYLIALLVRRWIA
jgi:hypothetical protein